MRFGHLCGLAVLALGFGFATSAQAALEVTLGEVNTSVGIKPTTTANKWKLQTDPEIDSSSTGPDLSTYIPVEGSLCDSYDPTKFMLATDPTTGLYGIGPASTVDPLGPFIVTGFDVLMKGGGVVDVQINPLDFNGPAIIKDIGNVSGGEAGQVLNITYELLNQQRAQAGPVDLDQYFYEINLVQIGTDPNFTPGVVTTFGNVNSFLTIDPISDPTETPALEITTTFNPTSGPNGGPNFTRSTNVPEPTSLSLLAIGILSLTTRRNRGQ
jgi:hypothetical protein